MANRNDSKNRRNKEDIEDQLVAINRITKVVKGGRRQRFAALVVVGDKKGHVGFGTGKATEVPEAIRKAVEAGKKNMILVPTVGTTIPHEVLGHYGSGNVLLKPAEAGSGIAAGGAVRIVMDHAGIGDVTSSLWVQTLQSTLSGPLSMVCKKLKTREDVLKLRESAKSLQD